MSNFIDESIRDKVVIITGGSRGFGWFIAEKLLEFWREPEIIFPVPLGMEFGPNSPPSIPPAIAYSL